MKISICTPQECDNKKWEEIADLVLKGGQVVLSKEAMINKIKSCKYISYGEKNGKIISCCALKDSSTRKEKIFKSSQGESIGSEYRYELGYIATEEKERGNGYSTKLISAFLSDPQIYTHNLYAVTKDENIIMQKILTKVGFSTYGKAFISPFKNSTNTLKLFLLTRN